MSGLRDGSHRVVDVGLVIDNDVFEMANGMGSVRVDVIEQMSNLESPFMSKGVYLMEELSGDVRNNRSGRS